MTDDVVLGAAGVEQVEFSVALEPTKGRARKWRIRCQACGDSGLAANRVQAGKAAAVHARTAHGGARARVVMTGDAPRTTTLAVRPQAQ